jgi:hypothetical protein
VSISLFYLFASGNLNEHFYSSLGLLSPVAFGIGTLTLHFTPYQKVQVSKSADLLRGQNTYFQLSIGLFWSVVWYKFHQILSQSIVLPSMDAISSSAYARLIATAGRIPLDMLPFSPKPFTYPPGLPTLLSHFYSQDGILSLRVFRELNAIALVFMPLVFARFLEHLLFRGCKPQRLLYLSICFFVGFFLVDRSLVMAMPYAGKNAQIIAVFLLMTCLIWSLRSQPKPLNLILGTLGFAGVFLIHYSTIYISLVLFSIIASFELVLNARPKGIKNLLRNLFTRYALTFSSFASGVALFFPHAKFVQNTSLGEDFSHKSFSFFVAAELVWKRVSQNSRFLEIFGHFRQWEHKETVFLSLFLLSLCFLMFSCAKNHIRESIKIWLGTFCLGFSVILCSLFSTGMIPGILLTFDFTRWFVFYFTSSFFGLFLWAMATTSFLKIQQVALAKKINNILIKFHILPLFLMAIVIISFTTSKDFNRFEDRMSEQVIKTYEFQDFAHELHVLEKRGDCQFLFESAGDYDIVFAASKILNFVPYLSNCKVLSGTWTYSGIGDRLLNLNQLPADNSVTQKILLQLNSPLMVFGSKTFLKKITSVTSTSHSINPIGFKLAGLEGFELIKLN